MGVVLDRRGQAVMAALAAGRKLSDTPVALVEQLMRHDLARVEGGRLVATEAGRGWSVRDARPDGANRVLAERTLPSAAGGGRRVTVNLGESTLGWLRARGHVTARQYEAGERVRGDWERAQLAPSVTMRWDAAATPGGGGGAVPDPTGAQLAAKRRFEAAVTAAGPGLADVLWRVACAGEGMEAAERALGWPKRAGKLVLGLALDRLRIITEWGEGWFRPYPKHKFARVLSSVRFEPDDVTLIRLFRACRETVTDAVPGSSRQARTKRKRGVSS